MTGQMMNSRSKLFQAPHVSFSLALLVWVQAFTHFIFLLLNQPAVYWLDPRSLNPIPAFTFLLRGGPWLYLAVGLLYLALLAGLLLTLNASAGWVLAGADFLFHWVFLQYGTQYALVSIFDLSTATICETAVVILPVVSIAAFSLIASVHLSLKVTCWIKPAGVSLMLVWVLFLSAAVFRAAAPQPSLWTPVVTAHSPSPRAGAAVAYDTQRKRAVLFGGIGSRSVLSDGLDTATWEWDGQDWHEIKTRVAPSGRYDHAMAYDEARGKVVLFGGVDANGNKLGDIWEWDGVSWTRICPVCNPAERALHQMIYDPDRKQVVMYGGLGEKGYPEAWAWDGSAWSSIGFSNSSPASYNDLFVYDASRKRAVNFIGGDWGGTWIWSGDVWSKLDLPIQPPLRSGMAYAQDPATNNIYLFSGSKDGSFFRDTWMFDGQAWDELKPAVSPPARNNCVSFYDAVRKSMVIFGGDAEFMIFNDMWELKLSEGIKP